MRSVLVLAALTFVLFTPTLSAAGNGYRDPQYMVDARWLSTGLEADNLLILDARGPIAYKKGHIQGAIPVKWQDFAVTLGRPGSPKWGVALNFRELASKFGEVGVNESSTVVVYGNSLGGWGEDGRFIWMLRMIGIKRSMFLNGGFNYWKENGYPVVRGKVEPIPVLFKVKDIVPELSVDTDWIIDNRENIRIVDSRTPEEYEGARKYGEARGGRLPGAVHVPYLSLFLEDGRLKPQEELENLFTKAGIGRDETIAAYCTAGIRSAFMVLALKMAGFTNSANYDQSFYRWAALKELPVE